MVKKVGSKQYAVRNNQFPPPYCLLGSIYMFKKNNNRTAQSTMEYAALLILIFGAFLVFQKYILNAFSGRWKAAGDYWAEGMIYDPESNITIDCKFDPVHTQSWYDYRCYQSRNCAVPCYEEQDASAQCKACITACQRVECND